MASSVIPSSRTPIRSPAVRGRLRGRARAIADRFHQLTAAVVDLTGLQIGALTFLGLGVRVLPNAAAGLAEQLGSLAAGRLHARETAGLTLLELPTVGSSGLP